MSEWNQTSLHGVSPVQTELRTKEVFATACIVKEIVFHTEVFEFRE